VIDFTSVKNGTAVLADLQTRYTQQDLIAATNASIDTMLALIQDAQDSYVTFQPDDPHANDPGAAPGEEHITWTLGHVIVHTTASAEEAAANAASLARGVEVTWRNRYEVPWQTMQTAAQLRHRLEESRRIRLAYLNAWLDEPHLDVLWTKLEKKHGALNAVGYALYGLYHDSEHVGQIGEIMRQARAALG